MRSRRNEADLASLIGGVAMLLVFTWYCVPHGRGILITLALSLVAMALVSVVAIVIRSRRSAPTPPFERHVDWQKLSVVDASAPQPVDSDTPLVTQLRTIDWFQFEKLVALLYRKQGYSVSRRGGANPDGGIDLIIEKVGRRSAVQCKQWKTWKVGVKAIREFLGAITDANIHNGIFITLCGYSSDAKALADKHHIEIINETGLTQMLEQTEARFDPELLEILRDARKFCPKCETEMVLRTAGKGRNMGSRFWGCRGYPTCRFTLPA